MGKMLPFISPIGSLLFSKKKQEAAPAAPMSGPTSTGPSERYQSAMGHQKQRRTIASTGTPAAEPGASLLGG